MEASSISEHKDSLITRPNGKFLRSAVLYGANSSGKTNFISAFSRIRTVILSSVRLNEGDKLMYSPFLLSETSEAAPTRFEMEFMTDEETSYRYGFSYTGIKIMEEWLFSQIKNRTETPLFIRDKEGIAVSDNFPEGTGKEDLTNDNRLFLSLVAQLNGKTSQKIIEWFQNYEVISGLDQQGYLDESLKMIQSESSGYKEALSLFQRMKLGFQNIFVEEKAQKELERYWVAIGKNANYAIKTTHNKYDDNGEIAGTVIFDKEEQESAGSNKIIDLSGPLFTALITGRLLIVDELDAKLHPILTRRLVRLFNNPETNPNKAQLIFATHDTNLLSTEIFRRDQIWFTEKDNTEQTDLYSLVEFKLPDGAIPGKDSNLEKNYIRGRYGAVPFITFD
jgi:AAA15 family ATPase/GTPase